MNMETSEAFPLPHCLLFIATLMLARTSPWPERLGKLNKGEIIPSVSLSVKWGLHGTFPIRCDDSDYKALRLLPVIRLNMEYMLVLIILKK